MSQVKGTMDLRFRMIFFLLTLAFPFIHTECVCHDEAAINESSKVNTTGNGTNEEEMTEWEASQRLDKELRKVNSITAKLSWEFEIGPVRGITKILARLGEQRSSWRNSWCDRRLDGPVSKLPPRQAYLLCRGPKYTVYQMSDLNTALLNLQFQYTAARVCRDFGEKCYRGEPDLERLMKDSRDPSELMWAWQGWRRAVGPRAFELYAEMVALQNQGARNNGYRDIGECWREELEIPDLENVAEELYRQMQHLYVLLHAVVRYRLHEFYGERVVPAKGPIPAHVLGNMWAQDWESLLDIVIPQSAPNFNLTATLIAHNYTVHRMVRQAEDFFTSLGLDPMTESFWANSVFEKPNNRASENGTCHGMAANMYQPDDYRILICAEVNGEDFYVIHHEMGHIEYYMAYKDQPTIFQDGANSAFQEAVGDAVMYGVLTPQHLQRLGLIDSQTAEDLDLAFLIRQALSKLPQLSFGLLVDKWRYGVFRGDIKPAEYNTAWWHFKHKYQGVKPPIPRADDDFDPAAKFHISDNTPYMRYFISGVVQIQMFKAMCELAVLGKSGTNHDLPIPLHRCDIYGSKLAGAKLRSMMRLGSSQPWQEALFQLTGTTKLDVMPLLQYFEPVYHWLLTEVERYDIPVGWD